MPVGVGERGVGEGAGGDFVGAAEVGEGAEGVPEATAETVEEVDVAERVEVARVAGEAVEEEEVVGSLKLVAVRRGGVWGRRRIGRSCRRRAWSCRSG